jgi:hypothetical protein
MAKLGVPARTGPAVADADDLYITAVNLHPTWPVPLSITKRPQVTSC